LPTTTRSDDGGRAPLTSLAHHAHDLILRIPKRRSMAAFTQHHCHRIVAQLDL